MITCLVTNWGFTLLLGFLLASSEWLAKTKRFKENCIIDFISHYLKTILKVDK
jgi:hypothetical protein